MTHKLNEVPIQLLAKLTGVQLTHKNHNPYPHHIRVIQDVELTYYQACLEQLIFPNNQGDTDKKIAWQLQEAYRVINAAIACKHPSTYPWKKELKQIRKALETEPVIIAEKASITKGDVAPDIFCSGHGYWQQKNGYVDLRNYDSEVLFYCDLSDSVSNDLGTNVENHLVDKKAVLVDYPNNPAMHLPLTKKSAYPHVFNKNSKNSLVPNFHLCTDYFLKARLIEDGTGSILHATKREFTLREILDMFPKRRIHWAACMTTLDTQFNKNPGNYWIDKRSLTSANTSLYLNSTLFNNQQNTKKRKCEQSYDADFTPYERHGCK